MLINFTVDLLLLMGSCGLCGYSVQGKRCCIAAAIGGVYGGICLVPGMAVLGHWVFRFLVLGIMAAISYGMDRSAAQRGIIFILLSMSLSGIVLGIGNGGILGLILSAAVVCGLCVFGFRGRGLTRRFAAVELFYRGKRKALTALQDTGNCLRDPISGVSVPVAGADIAWELLGLTPDQLAAPVETVQSGKIPGLRLIPYHSVGRRGMLLALQLDRIRINGADSSTLLAFAPERLGNDGYQMLTGGTVS